MIKLTVDEFLNLIKVVKMLYGRELAESLFSQNIDKYIRNYELMSASAKNNIKKG